MEDMYMHQHAKVEPNRSRDGAAIGADARTRSPPTQTILPQISTFLTCIFIHIYLYTLYIRQTKIYKLTDIPLNQNKLSEMFNMQ